MDNAPYECTTCNQKFWTQQMRDIHFATCHPKIYAPAADNPLMLTCTNEGCGMQFSRRGLNIHSDACRARTVPERQIRRLQIEKMPHKREQATQAVEFEIVFPCDKCGSVETTTAALNLHKIYCNRSAPRYRCRRCGEQRSNAVLLRAHEMNCHGSSSAPTSAAGYRCDGCGAELDSQTALNLHKIFCPARSR